MVRNLIAITTAALVSVLAGPAAAVPAAAVPAAAVPAAASAAQPAAHPGIGPLSRGELTPDSGSSTGLDGVYCTSAASCWAVGYFERNGAFLNEALRWDGHRWSRAVAPSPGGTASGDTSELFGVRCTRSANCWAVGFYERHGVQLDEALHWNGKNWSMVATPTPAGILSGDFSELLDVSCTSPDSCWAAGEYGNDRVNSEVIENQALHWNGKAWSLVTTPDPGDAAPSDGVSALSAIRCSSASNCWAIGSFGTIATGGALFNEALRWNGHKWSQVGVPDPAGDTSNAFNALQGLSCTSAVNCWAAGSEGSSGSSPVTLNQALHWNGHQWSAVSTPQPDGTLTNFSNVLTSVNCSAPDNCWAVGYIGNLDFNAPVLNEALHWNGSHWTAVSVPSAGGLDADDHSFLYGIRCTSRTNCWAAGQAQPFGADDQNQLMHWNGSRWQLTSADIRPRGRASVP